VPDRTLPKLVRPLADELLSLFNISIVPAIPIAIGRTIPLNYCLWSFYKEEGLFYGKIMFLRRTNVKKFPLLQNNRIIWIKMPGTPKDQLLFRKLYSKIMFLGNSKLYTAIYCVQFTLLYFILKLPSS